MSGIEHGRQFNASPEDFLAGREAFHAFSKNDIPENEPDYKISPNGVEKLRQLIESDIPRGQNPESQDWEPFSEDGKPKNGNRFINYYDGILEERLDLDRTKTEKVLDVAGMDNPVILSNARIDEGISSLEKESGIWRIKFDDKKAFEQAHAMIGDKSPDRKFLDLLNLTVRNSFREIFYREKLTAEGETDTGFFLIRVGESVLAVSSIPFFHLLGSYPIGVQTTILDIGGVVILNGAFNLINKFAEKQSLGQIEARNRYFLPPLEVDRYIRGVAFMKGKGRNLVRLRDASAR